MSHGRLLSQSSSRPSLFSIRATPSSFLVVVAGSLTSTMIDFRASNYQFDADRDKLFLSTGLGK